MAALIELGVGIMTALAHVTIEAALGLLLPVRYAVSGGFRKKKQREWSERASKKIVDVALSLLSFALLVACVAFWMGFFRSTSN
jgi:hypothetical protein